MVMFFLVIGSLFFLIPSLYRHCVVLILLNCRLHVYRIPWIHCSIFQHIFHNRMMGRSGLNMVLFLCRRTFLYLIRMVQFHLLSTSYLLENIFFLLGYLLLPIVLLFLHLLDSLHFLWILLLKFCLLVFLILLLEIHNSFLLLLLWSNLLMTSFLAFRRMLSDGYLLPHQCRLFLNIFDSLLVYVLLDAFLPINMVLMVAFLLL